MKFSKVNVLVLSIGLRVCLKSLQLVRQLGYSRGMEPRKPYPTDLSDKEWALIEHLVPTAKLGGRPETYPKREILNGIFYIVRGGGAWRLMPHDLPPWQIVYQYFWRWRQDGTWQRMHDLLRGDVRVAAGKRRVDNETEGGYQRRLAERSQLRRILWRVLRWALRHQ